MAASPASRDGDGDGGGRLPWWQAGIIAALAAAVVNAVIYGIARALDTIPQDVLADTPMGAEPVTIAPVLFASFWPILIAAGLYALLRRFTRQPIRTLWIITGIVLVLSLLQPLAIDDIPAKMFVTLDIMHVAAALVGIGTFTRLVRR